MACAKITIFNETIINVYYLTLLTPLEVEGKELIPPTEGLTQMVALLQEGHLAYNLCQIKYLDQMICSGNPKELQH